jgi:glycosyltransferase involved in cell wall biosynthesis
MSDSIEAKTENLATHRHTRTFGRVTHRTKKVSPSGIFSSFVYVGLCGSVANSFLSCLRLGAHGIAYPVKLLYRKQMNLMNTACTKTPLISVIIPTFNRAWALSEAIDSVLSQDYKNYEVIVVDDGSTDDTQSILDQYRAQITVIRHSNQGVSAARNRGVREANGDLIAFLDSDDLWLPGKLSTQSAFFQSRPDALICQTEEIWIRNGRRVNPKHRHKKPSGWIFEPSLALCLVSPSASMIRRKLFEEMGGFDESLPACEDYDLWLRIGCRFPVYLIDMPLIVKRGGHDDQLSRQPSLDRYRITSLINLIERDPLSSDQRRAVEKVLVEKCRIYAGGCLKRGRLREADYYQKLAKRFEV